MTTGTLALILVTAVAALALVFWRALNPPPQLEITERGILDRRLSLGWLEWSAIEGAYRPRSPDGDRLLLRVRVDERLGRKLGRRLPRDQAMPEQLELSLDLAGTRYSEVEVLQEIMSHSQVAPADVAPALPPERSHIPCR